MITRREQAILEAVCRRVRLLSLPLVVTGWGSATRGRHERMRAVLRRLVTDEWLTTCTALACPLLDLEFPLATWRPGRCAGDMDELSRTCRRRWTRPPEPVRLYLAGPRAVATWGGKLRQGVPHIGQVTHDLHVAAVYVRFLRCRPAAAQSWVGEDTLRRARARLKRPDALLVDATGRPTWAIEFAGRYSPHRLRRFHEFCAAQGLSYELW